MLRGHGSGRCKPQERAGGSYEDIALPEDRSLVKVTLGTKKRAAPEGATTLTQSEIMGQEADDGSFTLPDEDNTMSSLEGTRIYTEGQEEGIQGNDIIKITNCIITFCSKVAV